MAENTAFSPIQHTQSTHHTPNTHISHHLHAMSSCEKIANEWVVAAMPPWEHPAGVDFRPRNPKADSILKKGSGTFNHDVVHLANGDNHREGRGGTVEVHDMWLAMVCATEGERVGNDAKAMPEPGMSEDMTEDESDEFTLLPVGTTMSKPRLANLLGEVNERTIVLEFPTTDDAIIFYEFLRAVMNGSIKLEAVNA